MPAHADSAVHAANAARADHAAHADARSCLRAVQSRALKLPSPQRAPRVFIFHIF